MPLLAMLTCGAFSNLTLILTPVEPQQVFPPSILYLLSFNSCFPALLFITQLIIIAYVACNRFWRFLFFLLPPRNCQAWIRNSFKYHSMNNYSWMQQNFSEVKWGSEILIDTLISNDLAPHVLTVMQRRFFSMISHNSASFANITC